MDPTEKNWVEKYLQLRSVYKPMFLDDSKFNYNEKIYSYLQPTGLLYGHPIDLPKRLIINTSEWPIKERLEVIFLESLFSSFFFNINDSRGDSVFQMDDFSSLLIKFYDLFSPDLLKKSFFDFKEKKGFQLVEQILCRRVNVKAEWNKNFWQGFFHNILLFADVIVFSEFVKTDNKDKFDVKGSIKNMHWQIISILARIINIDEKNAEVRKEFFTYFVDSSVLNKNEYDSAFLLLDNASEKQNTELERLLKSISETTWLARKYILELAVLSVWADNTVSIVEKDFLEVIAEKINMDTNELEASALSVEAFVLQNWNKVHYLQQKQSYLVLSKRMVSRMKKISKKYAGFIKNEISENKELIHLLKTSQERQLSSEEKNIIRQQLIDILKSVPAFIILALPMSFLTVPVLLKILPKELFPSSFNPNALTQRGRNRIIE